MTRDHSKVKHDLEKQIQDCKDKMTAAAQALGFQGVIASNNLYFEKKI
tara:strand:+ start:552 stop:695 length:144 start_codon:yes stop_codon:yes gene_type:complete